MHGASFALILTGGAHTYTCKASPPSHTRTHGVTAQSACLALLVLLRNKELL